LLLWEDDIMALVNAAEAEIMKRKLLEKFGMVQQ
jgi:hypothetical protein